MKIETSVSTARQIIRNCDLASWWPAGKGRAIVQVKVPNDTNGAKARTMLNAAMAPMPR